MKEKFIVILVTTSSATEAAKIARSLVEGKVVACGNIVPGVRSLFRWEGKISDEDEALLIMKTKAKLFDEAEARIKELHSYDVPEIISLPIRDGNQDYLDWLDRETK